MAKWIYIVDGEVVPKGRPRFTKNGHVYTPQRTRNYEDKLRYSLLNQGAKPTDKAVGLRIIVERQFLKSWSKKQLEEAQYYIEHKVPVYAPTRPDLDNYIKVVLDACNGVLFDDDNQVVELHATKRYGEKHRLIIKIQEMA